MPLPKNWLVDRATKGITNLTSSPYRALAEKLGYDMTLLPPIDIEPTGIPEGVSAGILSEIGGLIGSPLGLLPLIMNYYSSGIGRLHQQEATKVYTPERLRPNDIFTLIFRGAIPEDAIEKWYKDLLDQGWTPHRIDAMREAIRPILSLGEIGDLYRRGEFGKDVEATDEAIRRITSLGYSEDDAREIVKLFFYIPPATDMIRMVVREAWRDDVAELFETDEGYEGLPFDTFAKAGVSPEWLRAYWRSHWELPSLRQGFEMLHRGVIDFEALGTLLRVQDVMPYWRDKLTAIAYTPLTRVDVRRMYKLGVLDDTGVLKAYHDIGYNDTNALLMLEFTKEYVNTDEPTIEDEVKELTRAQVLAGYRELVIDRETASQWLQDLTYPSGLADFFLMLEDIKEAERQVKDELSFIGKAYGLGTMTREEMIDRLGKLNLPSAKSDYYTEKFDRDRVTKAQRPSVADIKAWYKSKLIDSEEFADEMSLEGFSDYYISKYMEQIKG